MNRLGVQYKKWSDIKKNETFWIEFSAKYAFAYYTHVIDGRRWKLVYHLFVYICWSYRMVVLKHHYNSIAPSNWKGDISASAICHL